MINMEQAETAEQQVPIDAKKLTFVLDNCDCVFPREAERPNDQSPFVPPDSERLYDISLLYLGNRRVAEDPALLRLLGCTHVVNAAALQVASALATEEGGPRYLQLDLDDRVETVDAVATRAIFSAAADFIDEAMCKASAVVYVHCAGGVSRSASIVLAWLVLKRGMKLCDAWRMVQAQRPVIGPNASFMNVLLDLENETTGKETMQRPLHAQQRGYTCIE
jgi:protein-tyrosine phosphatase